MMSKGSRRRTGFGLSGFAVLLVCGCQTPMQIRSAFGPGVNYARFGSTFAWWPEATRGGESRRVVNPTFDEFLRQTITDGLAARGYRLETADPPDLLIDYAIVRKSLGGLRHASWSSVQEEGSLIIDVLDGRTRKHVWRGYATAQLDESRPPAEQKQRVREAVRRILERFPREGTQ